jgi:signal peptidase I
MIKDNTINKIFMNNSTAPENKNQESFWKELAKLLAIAAVIVVPFRAYVAQPFIVDGASMDPTFTNGQYLIVDELSYHFKSPERGSVLIFKFPKDTSKYFIKRVIGLPGETVSLKSGKVFINSKELDEPYIKYTSDNTLSYTLAEGEYFVMGDNRSASADSRLWGPVPTRDIVGRPILRLWPLSIWPGKYDLANSGTGNNSQ